MSNALHPADARLHEAVQLMSDFAKRTGLDSGRSPRRYLWTDAFAVCNFLGLARATGETVFGDRALRLIDQVHRTLGRYRPANGRVGWLSGLDNLGARAHPTQGGLRIGKRLRERSPSEPYDPRLEWERDGQYFHYLTKWMHALDQTSRSTGDPRFNVWARELARTACRSFLRERPGTSLHLAWKMSVDLSRPLVEAAGMHDALDGFVTLKQLQETASALGTAHTAGTPDLEEEIVLLASMRPEDDWMTGDLLGIGGLLGDAGRLAQLLAPDDPILPGWLAGVLHAAVNSLLVPGALAGLRRPAGDRLAFRELGFAIGLQALGPLHERVLRLPEQHPQRGRILALADRLGPFVRFGADIETFWRRPVNRRNDSWEEHLDINDVMLATCLQAGGFFTLPLPDRDASEDAGP